MDDKKKIERWPENELSGAKRANLVKMEEFADWFVGFGKDESCQFEGTWWDMIHFARNVLSSPNTELVAPEFYKPEWREKHYIGGEPYEMVR